MDDLPLFGKQRRALINPEDRPRRLLAVRIKISDAPVYLLVSRSGALRPNGEGDLVLQAARVLKEAPGGGVKLRPTPGWPHHRRQRLGQAQAVPPFACCSDMCGDRLGFVQELRQL